MASEPQFVAVPVIGVATVSTANTNRDGSGTIADILTGATNGTRISKVTIAATVTTTAGIVRLYIYNGSAYFLYREILVPAITVSGSVAGFSYVLELLGERALILPNNWKLGASTHNAQAFHVTAEGGNF